MPRITRREGVILCAALALVVAAVAASAADRTAVAGGALGMVLLLVLLVQLDQRRPARDAVQRVRRVHQKLDGVVRRLDRLEASVGAHRSHSTRVAAAQQESLDRAGARHESALRRSLAAFESLRIGAEDERRRQEEQSLTVETLLRDTSAGVGTVDERLRSLVSGRRSDRATQERLLDGVVQNVEALLQLYGNAPADGAHRLSPLAGQWAMAPTSLLQLVELVERHQPLVVLEIGGGTSTIWLGRALAQVPGARLVSIEHEEHYAALTRAWVEADGLAHVVDVRHAPLVEVATGLGSQQWYDLQVVSDVSDIDLLVVDGPPKATGAMARYPAVPLLADRLRDGCLVVLDDADREDETATLARWEQENPGSDQVPSTYPGRHVVLRLAGTGPDGPA